MPPARGIKQPLEKSVVDSKSSKKKDDLDNRRSKGTYGGKKSVVGDTATGNQQHADTQT